MMKYFYAEEQRAAMQTKVERLIFENSIDSTTEAQREANEHRIKQLEFLINRRDNGAVEPYSKHPFVAGLDS